MLKKFVIVLIMVIAMIVCILIGFECNNITIERLIKIDTYNELLNLANKGDEENYYKVLNYIKNDKDFSKEEVSKFEDIGIKVLQGGADVKDGMSIQRKLISDDVYKLEILRWTSLIVYAVCVIVSASLAVSIVIEKDNKNNSKKKRI